MSASVGYIRPACALHWTVPSKRKRLSTTIILSIRRKLSRNLLFLRGTVLDKVFNGVIDRTRSKLAIKRVRTIFGKRRRPHHCSGKRAPRFEVVIEKSAYDMTAFKVIFDCITIKIYSKGAHQQCRRTQLRQRTREVPSDHCEIAHHTAAVHDQSLLCRCVVC